MRIIFLGTASFSSTVLKGLIRDGHNIVAVVCQPDKPSGRGNKVIFPEIKMVALELNIPVYQFNKIRVDGVETLKNIGADIMVTASYGQILSQEIIDICPFGIINVHGSLLPKFRGATPIQSAIMEGEKETGVTIMKTEAGIDTGDMLISEKVKIEDDDTYGSLSQKMAEVGARLCSKALSQIENGDANFTPQDETKATYCKMFKKEDTKIDFNKSSKKIVDFIRALNPNPIAYFMLGCESFKVFSARSVEYSGSEKNGTVIFADGKKGFVVRCLDGAVELLEITPPSSKKMSAKSYLNGKKIELGSICNE